MHEMAIAVALLQQLESAAREHGLARIESVTVRTGVFRQVVPEALETAFAALAQGTRAEGAALRIELVPARARCRQCGHAFEPETDSFLCPQCHQADAEILEGDDIVLASLTGDQPTGAESDED
jgi:hydrogenase nickel incorporation protein HypA/HybF